MHRPPAHAAARLRRLAAAALRVALLVSAGVWLMRDRFVFYPTVGGGEVPPGVQERWIQVPAGPRLHALFVDAGPGAPLLLWSHGNAGNVTDRSFLLPAFVVRGMSVLAYDYRGYGLSAGSPTEQGVYEDAAAAYGEARALGFDARRIVLLGESLGGAVSIQLATQRPCAGVAVVSTFNAIRDVGRHHYGPLGLAMAGKFDSAARVASIGVPILVAHGDADELVPHALGGKLFDAARQPKEFLRIAGGTHDDAITSEEFLAALRRFAQNVTRR